MLRIAIIIGSVRPARLGPQVAEWVLERARARGDAEFELIDLLEVGLPFLDEPEAPSYGRYTQQHTKDWAARVAGFDGFVLVTPEYNHGPTPALKNALDFCYAEWGDKAVGFVSYGSDGGVRAVEQLRLVCAELHLASVQGYVAATFRDDFSDNFTRFSPQQRLVKKLDGMLSQLLSWSGALKTLRAESAS